MTTSPPLDGSRPLAGRLAAGAKAALDAVEGRDDAFARAAGELRDLMGTRAGAR